MSGVPRWMRRLLKNWSALAGIVIVAMLLLVVLLGPSILSHDPYTVDVTNRMKPPSLKHLLGTDRFGRDILSRVLAGGRMSLGLGLGAVAIGSTIGILLGVVAGYFRGWVDQVFTRLTDVMIAFGQLLLAVVVLAILGPGLLNAMVAIGVALIATFARFARAEVIVLREDEFIEASVALGSRAPRIMALHLLPNILGGIIVVATLQIGSSILAEASLSFLGLGASPPTPSWGLMVSEGLASLSVAPWVALGPGLAILATVLGFNLLGDGLRDIFDPRS